MSNSKFLLPTADIVFKRTFGNNLHKNICIDFLNSVLDRKPGHLITEVDFLDTFNNPKNVADRLSILDIRCTDQKKKTYIIEVQVAEQRDFGMRSQYYVSRVLSAQLDVKGRFSDLTPVIFVGVLNFSLFDHTRCVSHHVLTDTVDGNQYLDLLEAHFIELPKFLKTENELSADLDKWIFFLKEASKYLDVPQKIAKGNSAIIDAFDIVSRHNWSKIELEVYEKELDIARCQQSALETAEEKGIEKGIEKGKIETARAMLAEGLDIPIIAKVTGLTIDQIKGLK